MSYVSLPGKRAKKDVPYYKEINEILSELNLQHCGIRLNQSQTTNSVYVEIRNSKKKKIILRFSDHQTPRVISCDNLYDVFTTDRALMMSALQTHVRGKKAILVKRPNKDFWERTKIS